MIETTMKLVDSTDQGIVPVYETGIDDGPEGLFAPVIDVADSVCTGPLLGNLVFLVKKVSMVGRATGPSLSFTVVATGLGRVRA